MNVDITLLFFILSIQEAEPLIILPITKAPERICTIDIPDDAGEIDEDEWTDRNFLASGTSEADKSRYFSFLVMKCINYNSL